MKKIEILGIGCSKCDTLAGNAEAAAQKAGIACEVIKVTDITKIMEKGVIIPYRWVW